VSSLDHPCGNIALTIVSAIPLTSSRPGDSQDCAVVLLNDEGMVDRGNEPGIPRPSAVSLPPTRPARFCSEGCQAPSRARRASSPSGRRPPWRPPARRRNAVTIMGMPEPRHAVMMMVIDRIPIVVAYSLTGMLAAPCYRSTQHQLEPGLGDGALGRLA
jgi:hypothetical protein